MVLPSYQLVYGVCPRFIKLTGVPFFGTSINVFCVSFEVVVYDKMCVQHSDMPSNSIKCNML